MTPPNANITGTYNTYLGTNSGPGTPTQLDNSTAIGNGALVMASNQVVIGNDAVTSTILKGIVNIQGLTIGLGSGSIISNTAVGISVLSVNTSGNNNSGFGNLALSANTIGNNNSASGNGSLQANTAGNNNTGTGNASLQLNTSGTNNAAAGFLALYSNTSGGNNTAVGLQAGVTGTMANANVTGSNNTFIGFNCGPGTATQLDNSTAIGNGALVMASNQIVIGNVNIAQTVLKGRVNIPLTVAPASSSAAGNAGDTCYDSGYCYVCTSTNSWKRSALVTF